jgi:hypothetical protein
MVYNTQNYMVFWTFSIVLYSRKYKIRRFGKYISFHPEVSGGRHLLSCAPEVSSFKGFQLSRCLPPSNEDVNRSGFRNIVFLFSRIRDDGKSPKTQ